MIQNYEDLVKENKIKKMVKGVHHNEKENKIHLEKCIKFTVEPIEFNEEEFINANKQWLCTYLYQDLMNYLHYHNFVSAVCMDGFVNSEIHKEFPSGIIYFNKIPIRWTFGLFGHSAFQTSAHLSQWGMFADFIGRGVNEEIKDES